MAEIIEFLARHGGLLVAGLTVLLGLAVLATRLSGEPVHRQRLGEAALAATLLWLVLACVPMPRFDASRVGWVRQTGLFGRDATQQGAPEPALAPGPSTPPAVSNQGPPANVRQERADATDSSPTAAPGRDVVSPDEVRSIRGQATPLSWPSPGRPVLVILYLAGVGGCLLWMATGRVLLARTERAAARPEPWLVQAYQSLPADSHQRRAELLVSDRCRRPLVYGLWRRRIVLPAELCRPERAVPLRHVLLHESVHVWRGDAWGNFLSNVACPLLYFHPLYWWLRFEVEFSRDLVADDWAARFSSKESYVDDLVQLVRGRPRMPLGSMAVLGVFRWHTPFYRRMTMLIDRKRPLAIRASTSWRLTGLSASGIVMAVMVGLVGMPRAGADSDARASVTALPGGDRAADAAPNSVRDGAAHVAAPNQPNNSQRDSRREGGAPEKMPEEMLGLPGQPSEQLSFLDAAPGDFEIENCLVALAEDFQVPAQTAGVLEAVEVREGDVVTSGQRVARIDDEQVRLKLEEAKASLEELKAKELTLEEATVEARHAQELLAQVKAGYEAGVKPVEMMSRCSLDSDLAKVRVAKAEADLESARQLRAVQVAAAESELNRYRVEAPLGGIVVETHRRVGEWVNPGDPVCRIVNVAKLRVEGFVSAHLHPPEAVADRDVTVGVFRGRTGAEVVPGKIIFVDPSVTSSNEYRVWAEVENPNRNGQWVLRPGQRAKMTVKMTRQTGRAAKPEEPND